MSNQSYLATKQHTERGNLSGGYDLHIWDTFTEKWITVPGSRLVKAVDHEYERIDYWKYGGPPQDRPIQWCSHEKVRFTIPSGGQNLTWVYPTFFVTADAIWNWYGYEASATWAPTHQSYTSSLEELTKSVALEIAGTQPFEQNVLLDVIEIVELKQLVAQGVELVSMLMRYSEKLSRKRALQTIINLDLADKFGIEPMSDTIAKLWNWQETVQKRADELQRFNGKYRKVIRKKTHVIESNEVGSPLSEKRYTVVTEIVGCHVKANYSAELGAILQMTMNMFGFGNILTTAWQHYPLSFIADWFLGIGNALQRQEDALKRVVGLTDIATDVHIKNAWYSVKKQTIVTGRLNVPGLTGDGCSRKCYLDSYQRYPGFPTGTSGAWLGSGFSLGKLVTSGELLFQKYS